MLMGLSIATTWLENNQYGDRLPTISNLYYDILSLIHQMNNINKVLKCQILKARGIKMHFIM